MPTSRAAIFAVLVASCCASFAVAACPDEPADLVRFSTLGLNGATEVQLVQGQRVLFDLPSFDFRQGLSIAAGAALWFSRADISISTTHIMVNGELHAGSESCPFENKLHITLIGGGPLIESQGQKFGYKASFCVCLALLD